ncbi:MAG: TylF/MycF family methyltransferase [Gammaproteobacteria bacterium]|nr:TylF/MycF family methyltransferase [Gammaproteobacteria bacterium]MDH5276084.1 TylF/MycF family methyltransferase [Gammaproteobacteria bacterium]
MNNDIFDVSMQDRVWKQQFFYNAFRALAFNRIDGDYAEFGSWSGSSFWLAHLESRRHGHDARLWAFDSFQGLPPREGERDEHPAWVEGAMTMSLQEFHGICARDGIPVSAYDVVPGFYHDTLDRMSAGDAPVNIALAFIDCDMYSSTKSVLRFLMPRLKHGMIIAFDDYFCWSATQVSGERRAMLEAFGRHERWQLLPYTQFGYHGQSFVVEDKLILGDLAGPHPALP